MALATNRLTPPLVQDWIPVTGAGLPDRWGGHLAAHGHRAGAPTKGDARLRRRSVLHPTDYSDASHAAFEVACELAGAGGVVTVLHVAEPPYVPLGMVPLPPPRPGYRAAWESQLRMVRPSDPAVGVEHRLAEGWPGPEILRLAQGSPWDLIVMGARRRGRLRRALAGGVSRAVVQKSERPVATLTVPERWPTGLKPKGVLFATDHPEPDAYAFALAHRIVRSRAGELTVLYIPSALRSRRAKRTAAEWRRLAAAVPGCRLQVQPGATTEEVLRAASALSIGLVVMSAWGRSRVRVLFDPAATVQEKAPCPVLTVFAPTGREQERPGAGPDTSDTGADTLARWVGPVPTCLRGLTRPAAQRATGRKRKGYVAGEFNGPNHQEVEHAA